MTPATDWYRKDKRQVASALRIASSWKLTWCFAFLSTNNVRSPSRARQAVCEKLRPCKAKSRGIGNLDLSPSSFLFTTYIIITRLKRSKV